MSNTFYVDPIVEAEKYGINVLADNNNPPMLKDGENGMIVKDGDGNLSYCKDITVDIIVCICR